MESKGKDDLFGQSGMALSIEPSSNKVLHASVFEDFEGQNDRQDDELGDKPATEELEIGKIRSNNFRKSPQGSDTMDEDLS